MITKKTAKKATGQSSNYQDAATAPVDRSNDSEAALQDEYESGDEADEGGDLSYSMSDLSDDVFLSVDKVRAHVFVLLLDGQTTIIISFIKLFVLFIPVLSASKAGFVRLKWPLNNGAKRLMLQSKFLCSFSTLQPAGH